jgi:hypothetical protein
MFCERNGDPYCRVTEAAKEVFDILAASWPLQRETAEIRTVASGSRDCFQYTDKFLNWLDRKRKEDRRSRGMSFVKDIRGFKEI